MDLAHALHRLATYRAHNTRKSQQTFNAGVTILKSYPNKHLGDDGWTFLEQLALAALDVGRIEVADRCLQLLSEKFPDSPRINCLHGIRMEATESPKTALAYYDSLLDADSANAAIWKRKISVLRRMGVIDRAVDELSHYLDTFYTDVEGWLELADIYSSCNQYTHALQSLSHCLLLNPQSPFNLLQAAETAYTADDVPLAIKLFLLVVEMTDSDHKAPPGGVAVRAWHGVLLCSRRFTEDARPLPSASRTLQPTRLNLVRELAVERLTSAYLKVGGTEVGKETLAWLEGSAT